jgi:hypothetical protein
MNDIIITPGFIRSSENSCNSNLAVSNRYTDPCGFYGLNRRWVNMGMWDTFSDRNDSLSF